MERTIRDTEILEALALKVRLLSLEQVARVWWGGNTRAARDRMRTLERSGFIEQRDVDARPLLELDGPLVDWSPRVPGPEFGALAYSLKMRWGAPPGPTRAYFATTYTANLFGGVLKRPKCGHQSHDLHVAEVFLHIRAQRPRDAGAWIGEDALAHTRRHQKLPDAFLVRNTTEVFRVVEFAGSYDREHLASFHADCKERGLPYELW